MTLEAHHHVMAAGDEIARHALQRRQILMQVCGCPATHPAVEQLSRIADEMLAMSAGARRLIMEAALESR